MCKTYRSYIFNDIFQTELVKVLLDNGASTETTDACGMSPIFYPIALESGPNPDMLRFLIEEGGANVNVATKAGNFTPLYSAVKAGYTGITFIH